MSGLFSPCYDCCGNPIIIRQWVSRNYAPSAAYLQSDPGALVSDQVFELDGMVYVGKNSYRGSIQTGGTPYHITSISGYSPGSGPQLSGGATEAPPDGNLYTFFYTYRLREAKFGGGENFFRNWMRIYHPAFGVLGYYKARGESSPFGSEYNKFDLQRVEMIEPGVGGYVDVEPDEPATPIIPPNTTRTLVIFFPGTLPEFVPDYINDLEPIIFPS